MADKRISQLIERTDILNNDVLPIVASGATTTNKVTISTIQNWMQDNLDVGVTSVGITLGTSGTDVNVTGSPITTSGNITINIPTASATNRGLLSAADWSTFNAKQPAGNYVTLDTTQTITAHKTFTASGGQPSITINHSSGAGHALDITKAGNGEGIRVNKTSGSGNAMSVVGTLEATTLVRTGGTSSQFLKADGSVDSNTYVTTDTSQAITATKQFTQGLSLASAGGTNQLTVLKNIGTIHEGSAGSNIFGFNNSNNIYFGKGLNNGGVISWNNAAVRYYTLPDADGTLALTSQIPANPVGGTGTTNQIPKFSATSTLTNSNISDNGTEVNIQSRVFVTSGGEQFVFSPNLGGTSNRIETLGGLPLEITTDGSSIGMNVGGGSSQFSMTNTGAAFTIPVTSNGQAATSPAFIANNSTGASGTAQHYINFTAGTTTIARMLRGNGASGLAGDGLNIDNFGGFGIRLNQLGGSGGTFSVSGGAATFSSSVTTGGALRISGGGTFTQGELEFTSTTSGGQLGIFTNQPSSSTLFFDHRATGNTGNFTFRNGTGGANTLFNINGSTGAATFSSSVTANGTATFLGQFGNGTVVNEKIIQFTRASANTDIVNIQGINAGVGTGNIAIQALGGNVGIGTTSPSGKLTISSDQSLNNQFLNIVGTQSGFNQQYFIGIATSSKDLRFYDLTADTERMRISSTGLVGIGTASPSDRLDVNGSIRIRGNTTNFTAVTDNAVIDYVPTSIFATSPTIRIAAIGTASIGADIRFLTGTSTSLDERMRITSGGNVGIGTASPAGQFNVNASSGADVVLSRTTGATSGVLGTIRFGNTNIDSNMSAISAEQDGATNAANLIFSTQQSGGVTTERMRITSGGYLWSTNSSYWGSSANHQFNTNANGNTTINFYHQGTDPYGFYTEFTGAAPNNTSNYFAYFRDTVGAKCVIFSNGNIQNLNNSYGAISDAKLKENIEDATPKLDDLMKVKVRNYNLIGDDKKQIGVIAQELEEVFPAMIDESEDFEEVEVPQVDEEGNEILNEEGEVVTTKERVSKGTTTKSVKYSVFVPMLIKAMQEQQEQIKSLTEQVEALKSQING